MVGTETATSSRHLYNVDSRMAGHVPVAKTAEEGGEGFIGFLKTLIDVINPLHHIPVVGAVYRHITGDEISPAARIAGNTLFAGPLGAALAVADVAVEQSTGRDAGETMIALVTGDDSNKKEIPTQIAAAELEKIQPAAGPAADGIIWDTPPVATVPETEFPPGPTPASYRTGQRETELTARTFLPPSTPAAVPQQKNGDPTPVLVSQKAPAMNGRKPSSPELIAPENKNLLIAPENKSENPVSEPQHLVTIKMMEGLDKYAAMKKEEFAGRTFSANF